MRTLRQRSRRTQIVRITERCSLHRAFAERADLQREIRAAHARSLDRLEQRDGRAFLHRTLRQALFFGVVTPRLAVDEHRRVTAREDAKQATHDKNATDYAHCFKMRRVR